MQSDHEQKAEKPTSQTGELHLHQTPVDQPTGGTFAGDRKPYSKKSSRAVSDPERKIITIISKSRWTRTIGS